jgi:hypothetical protein
MHTGLLTNRIGAALPPVGLGANHAATRAKTVAPAAVSALNLRSTPTLAARRPAMPPSPRSSREPWMSQHPRLVLFAVALAAIASGAAASYYLWWNFGPSPLDGLTFDQISLAAAQKVTDPALPGDSAAAVAESVRQWAAAWSDRDVMKYLQSYSKRFNLPNKLSRKTWEEARRINILSKRTISVGIENLTVKMIDDGLASARFSQSYSTDSYSESGTGKLLMLVREDGNWRIFAEVSAK